MTSNDAPRPGARAGRRRALGTGPGEPPAAPQDPDTSEGTPPAAETDAAETDAAEPVPGHAGREAGTRTEAESPAHSRSKAASQVPVAGPEAAGPGHGSAGREGPPQDASASGPAAGPVPATVASRAASRDGPGHSAQAGAAAPPAPARDAPGEAGDGVFKVRLANFEGPFDLLLQLISRHKMDVTEVALSKVTDEFMAHIRAMGPDWDLDATTEFLVVAATLLDLKAARLLPVAEVEDEADLALLEARDLLFARLLQYRAYKQIAEIFNERLEAEARRYPRTVGLEPHHAELLPEVVISIGPEGFAGLAVKAMQPRPRPQVYVEHIHAPLVSVREQAGIVVARLRTLGETSFRTLVEDTDDTLTVVARFLALLELYREKAVELDQETALGDLLVRWTGGEGEAAPVVTDEFDRPPEETEPGKAEPERTRAREDRAREDRAREDRGGAEA